MPELSSTEIYHLLSRVPNLELSYETIPHMKVSHDYNICLAIPTGTKCYSWMTYYRDDDVCFIMELNKERKIARVKYTLLKPGDILANGTLLYGTLTHDSTFVIEDILMYQGIPAKQTLMNEKLGFMYAFLKEYDYTFSTPRFYLPAIWGFASDSGQECIYRVPPEYENHYSIHHIQYRCLNVTAPYLNLYPAKKGIKKPTTSATPADIYIPYRYANLNKPQYKQPAVFKVMADIQFDIYRLYAFGIKQQAVYYNVACIPSYHSSVFMNGLFRNIKENQNLDCIEESDNEDDFENISPEKYVDLKKSLFMQCIFHPKFKKWVPQFVVSPAHYKVVHINQL
jgi:hypothetical protein